MRTLLENNSIEKIKRFLALDCVTNFYYIVPFIIFFEAAMIIVQRMHLSAAYTSGENSLWYLGSYVALLSISIAALCILRKLKNQPDAVGLVSSLYSILLLLWGISLTYLDARQSLESVLIYAACVILVPMLCMMRRRSLIILELASDTFMLLIGIRYFQNVGAFAVNFIVFSIISLVVGISYREIRMRSYERQIQLEELSDLRLKYAYRDDLTGLQNRRAFSEKMDRMDELRAGKDFTIWIFDINDLKVVNDGFGHAAGDELICLAAECIAEGIGNRDKVFRIGGDEFAVIDMENVAPSEVGRRMREACSRNKGKYVSQASISYGYAVSFNHPKAGAQELEKIADDMMYANKAEFHKNTCSDKESRRRSC